MKLIIFLIVLFIIIAGFVCLYLWVSSILRKRRREDEDRRRELQAESFRQLQEVASIGYTPGETIPREFRSGVQNKAR